MTTFSKILFPTDFSPESRQALEFSLRLLGIQQGEVLVQHVVRDYFGKHSHWTTLFDIHEMQKYMDMFVDTEMGKLPKPDGLTFRNVLSKGRPGEAIAETADKEKVDLIVMGPSEGVVTSEVIRTATHPVLSIPAKTSADTAKKLQRIVVGTDFSEHSKNVVRYALGLKESCGLEEVFLVHAIEVGEAMKFTIRQRHFLNAEEKIMEWATNELENLTPHEYVKDPSVHRIVEDGDAAEIITRIANSKDAGLVVMGSHGHNAVGRFFVGPTTEKVLSEMRQPVLTLRI